MWEVFVDAGHSQLDGFVAFVVDADADEDFDFGLFELVEEGGRGDVGEVRVHCGFLVYVVLVVRGVYWAAVLG